MGAAVGPRRSDQYWSSAWRSIWFCVYTVRHWAKINYCTATLALSVNTGRRRRRCRSRRHSHAHARAHAPTPGCRNWPVIHIKICMKESYLSSVSLPYAILLTSPDGAVLSHLCLILSPRPSCVKAAFFLSLSGQIFFLDAVCLCVCGPRASVHKFSFSLFSAFPVVPALQQYIIYQVWNCVWNLQIMHLRKSCFVFIWANLWKAKFWHSQASTSGVCWPPGPVVS